MMVMISHQITGIGAILLYSNFIFGSIPGGGLDPRSATYIIGGWNFISSVCSLYGAKRFSRRVLFVGGNIVMAVCLYAFSAMIIIEKPILALVFLLLFLFSFQNGSGAITWLYCSEIAVDVSLGVVGMTGYFCTFVVSLGTQPLINSKLHLAGTFMLFATINLLAGLWYFLFLKETNGLTDKEKKTLYVPEDLK